MINGLEPAVATEDVGAPGTEYDDNNVDVSEAGDQGCRGLGLKRRKMILASNVRTDTFQNPGPHNSEKKEKKGAKHTL